MGYWNGGWNHWNGGWGGGWGYWNNGWWGWNGGFFWGALLGASLFSSYYAYPFPYYDYYEYPNYYYYPYTPTTVITSTPHNVVTTPSTSSDTLPANEEWIPVKNGDIPPNAIVNNQDDNGTTTYYCRAKLMNKINYGVLVPNDGCYIQSQSVTMRFTTYDVLVQK